MRSSSLAPLVLLFSLTVPSLCAPIPSVPGSVEEECIYYAACRPYSQRHSIKSKASPALREPHFPPHQLESPKQVDTVEVRLLEHHVTTPTLSLQAKTTVKNTELNAIIKPADSEDASPEKKHLELEDKSPSTEAISQSSSSAVPEDMEYSFTANMIKRVQRVAGSRSHNCDMMSGTGHGTEKHGDEKMTVTYTYGYSYIRTDYTSILVVGIVVIFMLLVILVELLDKVIETTKALLGLDQGAIRLEDRDCERHEFNTYSPKAFRLMPAPPPRSARSTPQLRSTRDNIVSEEKSESRL